MILLALSCGSEGTIEQPEPCDRSEFSVAIDIGHGPQRRGATSARGDSEWVFNSRMARVLVAALEQAGFSSSFLVDEAGELAGLADRTRIAEERGAQLLISIHHDSVQPHYLGNWNVDGQTWRYSDRFSGYAIFYSEENAKPGDSRAFAELLGRALREEELTPTPHHAEPIEGENRELVDRELGIYRFDGLGVLRSASMPAVLFECGVIVNRQEEERLSDPVHQKILAGAVVDAATEFCANRPVEPGDPAS
jgi:N-acetylmuramoyl-L-alanine amidase